ncbi:hypothetical protein [Candidatus Chloroploca sp. Khr17]|uniref:hypothetical protein n=1 Tax=Candidatus Chloroploca sp. Khr17 TaxID=2496869 RepID=UPI00101C17EB|nr:hypothetical protein [Candidatus Chloroploca sp. Khr17]
MKKVGSKSTHGTPKVNRSSISVPISKTKMKAAARNVSSSNELKRTQLRRNTANGHKFNKISTNYHAKLHNRKPKSATTLQGKTPPNYKQIKRGDVFSEVALENRKRVDTLRVLKRSTDPKKFKFELIENYRPVKGIAGVDQKNLNRKISQVKSYKDKKFKSNKNPELNALSSKNSNLVVAVPKPKNTTPEQNAIIKQRITAAKRKNVEIRQIP